MSLTDVIEEVMEDFNKRNNKLDVWKELEKRMKKEGIKNRYNRLIHEIDSTEAYKILKVWDAVDEHLNKKKLKLGCLARSTFDIFKDLSEIDGVEEVIKALGDSGFEMVTYKDIGSYARLDQEHIKFFETFAKNGLYKRYAPLSNALSKLGYKGINNYSKSKYSQDQIYYLTSIVSLEGDVEGAMYVLATRGYKIDESIGLNSLDIKIISKVVEEDKKEISEGKGGIPIYLYNTGNVELFQDYFNDLEIEKKKSVLRLILDYESKVKDALLRTSEIEIRCWLEKNYESLLREVGFEDVK